MVTRSIDEEVVRVNGLTRSMLDSYSLWGSKIEHGNTQHAMYGELLEFVNLRMETADSCLTLIENEKIADAF